MPKLLSIVQREAPGITISLRPTYGSLPIKELEDGTYDLAVAGFYRNLPDGFYRTRLFKDDFAVGFRKDHPEFSSKLSKEDFYSARHALITLQGDFQDDMSIKVGKKQMVRTLVYGSYSFSGLAWVLTESNMLLTAPRLLLKKYAQHFPIHIVECPMSAGEIELQMVWHNQTHRNPLRVWLRQKLKEIF